MNSVSKESREKTGYVAFAIVISLLSLVAPAVFPEEIVVSPLLLFGVIFLSNISALIIRATDKDESLFSMLFFGRVVVSVLFAAVLIFIHHLAVKMS